MVKKNIKKFSLLLLALFFMGVTGVFMALPQLNAKYAKKHRIVKILSDHVLQLQHKLDISEQKITDYDFLAFKTNAFSKRYSNLSYILDTVYNKSFQYGFQPDLVLGVIQVESNYEPTAVSNRGAYGLMQVNLAVWRNELGIDENRIFDVAYNIDLGLKILRQYYDESGGNMKRALHLYNNGYKYNNTSYTGKVDSAVFALNPNRSSWETTQSTNMGY